MNTINHTNYVIDDCRERAVRSAYGSTRNKQSYDTMPSIRRLRDDSVCLVSTRVAISSGVNCKTQPHDMTVHDMNDIR